MRAYFYPSFGADILDDTTSDKLTFSIVTVMSILLLSVRRTWPGTRRATLWVWHCCPRTCLVCWDLPLQPTCLWCVYVCLRYLPQKKTISIVRDAQIKLIDFGSATYDEDHHGRIVATRHYRPIEIILGESCLWEVIVVWAVDSRNEDSGKELCFPKILKMLSIQSFQHFRGFFVWKKKLHSPEASFWQFVGRVVLYGNCSACISTLGFVVRAPGYVF